jgi:hypothetical protein
VDSAELDLLRATVRHWLADAAGGDLVATLRAEGWLEVAAEEPRAAWAVLLEEWADALSSAPVLDLFVLTTLGITDTDAVVVYPAGSPVPRPGAAQGHAGYVHGGWETARSLVWLDATGTGPTADAEIRRVEGIDPELGLGAVEAGARPSGGEFDPAEVAEAIAGARLLQASALLSLARRMQQLALDHVTTREQFGRPLASFQAVKHQLADCAVELEAARITIDFAAQSGDATAAYAARATAGRAAAAAGVTAQQLMGAMGFTWEIPLHRCVRRAHALDLLLGPWEHLAAELGRRLIADGRVPRLGAA